MSYLGSYKRLSRLIENESFEPMFSWGVRMALSGTLPVIWGLYTNRTTDAAWITLTAEAISWVEMKGSFTWHIRTLLAGSVLAILFAVIGTITGYHLWLSVLAMLVVGFFATLLKNIGDRASGLALCVYLLFIICNAYPANDYDEVKHRAMLVAVGAGWSVFLGIMFSALMPAEQPFRRQIALIWRAIAELIKTMVTRNSDVAQAVYEKEKSVRTALDSSYQFYERMVHQVSQKDHQQYELSQLRKAAGIVSANVIAIEEEIQSANLRETSEALRVKSATLFNAMQEAVNRISVFTITLKPEEKLLAISHINRVRNLIVIVSQHPMPEDEKQKQAVLRVLKHAERITKLLDNALLRIEQMGKDVPVFRSYSLIKTSFLIHPKYLIKNTRLLFNFNTLTTRYALRSAIAVAVALFINKFFNIDHGYWIPLSVMIIKQPYFGATLKKAGDRIAGTLLGVIAGGLLLQVPAGVHLKEITLFLTFLLMVYYIRKQYAVAAFIITINLVLLFNLEASYSNTLMVTRVLCTVGGALLAVGSGFALLPAWDKKWLPAHLADAIARNYEYFTATFYSPSYQANWTKNKRSAESKNSNVFDSFTRYLEEPGKRKSTLYYDIATHNVRITRNLNNIHLEQDEKKQRDTGPATVAQQAIVDECLLAFHKVVELLPGLDHGRATPILQPGPQLATPFLLNDSQLRSVEKLTIELTSMHSDMEKLLH
jgi:uncharacterized membrane protein YccC